MKPLTSSRSGFRAARDHALTASGSDLSTSGQTGASVAALYVETGGCYFGLPNVDAWHVARDARNYRGPHPVVAHPPCQRWGRFWHGSTRKPHQFRRGEDGGCFASALTAVRNYGGVLEHPAGSSAWKYFGIGRPTGGEGWVAADHFGGAAILEKDRWGKASRDLSPAVRASDLAIAGHGGVFG